MWGELPTLIGGGAALLEGESGEVGPAAGAGFGPDAVEVGVDGVQADAQQVSNVVVGLPTGD